MTAPTIPNYNVTSVANFSGNKLINLLQFVSDPDPSTTSGVHIFDYLPGILILLVLFLIVFLSLKLRGMSSLAALTAASLSNFVVTLLLYPLGVISGAVLVTGIILVPVCGFLLFIFQDA